MEQNKKQIGTLSQMPNNLGISRTGLFQEKLFTMEEVAGKWRMHKSTLRRHINQGRIQPLRIGGKILFPERILEDYMARSSSNTKVNIVEYTQPTKCILPEEVLKSKHITEE